MRVMPSYLDPEVLTTCNDCYAFDTGIHKSCSACDSTNIEVVNIEEEAQELQFVRLGSKRKVLDLEFVRYSAIRLIEKMKGDDNI